MTEDAGGEGVPGSPAREEREDAEIRTRGGDAEGPRLARRAAAEDGRESEGAARQREPEPMEDVVRRRAEGAQRAALDLGGDPAHLAVEISEQERGSADAPEEDLVRRGKHQGRRGRDGKGPQRALILSPEREEDEGEE